MKKTFLFLYTLLVFSGVYAQENKVKVEPVNGDKISLFSLKEVRLLDSDFKHIMDLNQPICFLWNLTVCCLGFGEKQV